MSFLRAALVAALVAAAALIAIPIGPVPVTLQVLVIAVATLVLSPSEVLMAMALYLALGAFGAPVFAGGGAGIGVVLGPTGGFLLGFTAGAPIGSLLRRRISAGNGRARAAMADAVALVAFVAITYAAGWAHFAVVTGRDAGTAFALAVAPFVVIDLGKCAAAYLVARGMRAAGLGD